MEIFLPLVLKDKYKQLSARYRAVFITAPCGFGKTTLARALVTGNRILTLSARDPALTLPVQDAKWGTLVLDDLQDLENETARETLCALLREGNDRRFLLLSRGPLPSWLMPFQAAGVLGMLTAQDLRLDKDTMARLLQSHGVTLPDNSLTALHQVTQGYPLAVELVGQRLERGETRNTVTLDNVRLDLFRYYEEEVLRRLDPLTRNLLPQLAPFQPITPELARMVSGDNHAGERLIALVSTSSMLQQDKLGSYHFWPLFRDCLLWELERTTGEIQRRNLYDRAALSYELAEDYGRALHCYVHSGNTDKVRDLLVKNAEMHPGMGHYLEMEPYYRALPEEEIRQSPALMQGMSMLCALHMDYNGSEQWYNALKTYLAGCTTTDQKREAKGRLAWLDIGLPQRRVEETADLFPKVFALLRSKEIRLPAFSVTSNLPSVMNGGKDFSPWSKRDSLLYAALRLPVEAVLGRDGVGLADCALTESKFEKGEDVRDRALDLVARLERIRQEGTPDMEFAVVGLLARVQMDAGHPRDARDSLVSLRQRLERAGESRFLPNIDAMICRVDMHTGQDGAVATWLAEKAPKDPQNLQVLKRYQYFTQAMVQLSVGDAGGALITLAPLVPYCQSCRRIIDGIQLNILQAIAQHRLGQSSWQDHLITALDTAREYHFVRTVSQYGAAVLPLLEACPWEGDAAFRTAIWAAVRSQAACYPDFLTPRQALKSPLSDTELQVLRLICAERTNAEIGQLLGIRLSTVKTHVSRVLEKLQVTRRNQAKAEAQRMHLVDI